MDQTISEKLTAPFKEHAYKYSVLYTPYQVNIKDGTIFREARIKFRFTEDESNEKYRECFPNKNRVVKERWYITGYIDLSQPAHLFQEDIDQTIEIAKKDHMEWLKKLKLSRT